MTRIPDSRLGLVLGLVACLATSAEGQRRGEYNYSFGGGGSEFYMPRGYAGNAKYDGRFVFARIKYRGGGRGVGWSHDYPRAESHFMRIMRSITTIKPFVEAGPIIGGNIIALDDPELMKYPVAYLSEPGGWFPNEKEVEGLRNYLTKGGFLIVDDFDGYGMEQDWAQFSAYMTQVMPKAKLIRVPQTHAIFDSFFKVDFEKLVAYRTGDTPQYWGLFEDNDVRKRIYVIVNYNQDIGDYWEWSDRGFNVVPSNEAYKLGVNYLIYALTH